LNSLLPFLQAIWRPTLEIGILGVGIYYGYRFLKGTRGQAVVTGFVVVLLVLTVSVRLLRLDVLKRWEICRSSPIRRSSGKT